MILNKIVFWLCFVVAVLTKKQLQQVFTREPSDVAATLGGKVRGRAEQTYLDIRQTSNRHRCLNKHKHLIVNCF